MADEFDSFDNPTIPENKKGMFGQILKAFDAPSNAFQGFVIDGLEGAKKGLLHERNYDFEETFSDEFRRENPEASYWLSGAMNLIADPLNFVPLGMLAKGVKNTKTAAGNPSPVGYVFERLGASEMPNDLSYFNSHFYQHGKAGQAAQIVPGVLEGVARAVNREMNPFMADAQALFRKEGLTTKTTGKVSETLTKLDNPELIERARYLENIPAKNRTPEEASELLAYTELGKKAQGQLGHNLLHQGAYGKTAKGLEEYMKTHFHSVGEDLAKNTFISNANNYSKLANKSQGVPEDVASIVYDEVLKAQGITNPAKHNLYTKKSSVSNSRATQFAQESSSKRKAALKGRVLEVMERPYKNAQELSDVLKRTEYTVRTPKQGNNYLHTFVNRMTGKTTPEKRVGIPHKIIKSKDGREFIMIQESFVSGDNLVGGLNHITLFEPNGINHSIISDLQDMVKVPYVGGKTPLVITPWMSSSKFAKDVPLPKVKGETVEAGMMNIGKLKPRGKPSFSPQLRQSAERVLDLEAQTKAGLGEYLNYLGKWNLATSPYQD